MNAVEEIATYVVESDHEATPASVQEEVRTLVKDYVGVALGGSATDSGRICQEFAIESSSGSGAARVIGTGRDTSPYWAAYANAVASHSVELDDVDELALFHFGPPVVSAALAAAESIDADGRTFLGGLAVGLRVMQALSDVLNPTLRHRGFHTTPVAGVFGAAASASKILGLGHSETMSAIGLAGAHASGLMEMYGPSMQKRINPAPAAANGLLSAMLAQRGFSGAATILDGERGVYRAFTNGANAGALVPRLESTEPLNIEYKAFACARPIHNAIGCALYVRDEIPSTSLISSMHLRRHPDWVEYHNNPAPKTYHEAQVSVNHGVAVALTEGRAFFEQFTDSYIADPEVQRLSKMLTIESDSSLQRGVSCHLRVVLQDGRVLESTVDYPRGSRQNPITEAQHREKVGALADQAGFGGIDEVLASIQRIEELGSIRELTAKL